MAKKPHLIVGCGYTGMAVARRLKAEGERVIGTSRSEMRRAEVESSGAKLKVLDLDKPRDWPQGPFKSVIVLAPPPDDPDRAGERVRDVIEHANGAPVVVVVSTRVFGDTRGTVTERTHPAPRSQLDQRWAAVDSTALYLRGQGHDVRVIRAANIYGPGRDFRARLLAGETPRVARPAPSTSRIHVDDFAALCVRMTRPSAPPVLVACDEQPSPLWRVLQEAARLLDVTPPETVPPEEATATSTAAFACRSLVRPYLGVRLRYPTYREGLRACLAPRQRAFS
jgi:nucleoside-diphosphate-sugar epimerase